MPSARFSPFPRLAAVACLLALHAVLPSVALAGDGGGSKVAFPSSIKWLSWDAAVKQAAAKGKPIGLVVYAHWCPRCRELAPAFANPEIAKQAKDLVMVHQNADDRPDWLAQKFGKYGGYVPRVFFLRPDGSVAEDIVSGHAKFPYFYQPHKLDQLKAAMAKAAAMKGKRKGG